MERHYFSSFQHMESEVRELTFAQGEAPDFRSQSRATVLGVEVTRLFLSSVDIYAESAKDLILDHMRALAVARELPAADVTAFFSIVRRISSAKRKKIAEAAVEVIARSMPSSGDQVSLEHRRDQPPEVDLILVSRVGSPDHMKWRWLEAGRVEFNPTELVRDAIERKAQRIHDYRTACDQCWLLLVADSFRPSGKLAIDDRWVHREFYSPFSRTYLLDFGRGRLVRLRTVENPSGLSLGG